MSGETLIGCVFELALRAAVKGNITWLGVGKKVLARQDIVSPLATGFTLPKSEALAVYVELPGLFEAHTVAFAAVQESGISQENMALPWRSSTYNQLNVNYRITF